MNTTSSIHVTIRSRAIQNFGKLLISVAILAFVSVRGSANACDLFALTDGNSSAQIDLGTQAGISNWTVDGNDQLNQQEFWYRIGDKNGEQSINSISSPKYTQSEPNTLAATYANSQISVVVIYTLTGGDSGTGSSSIAEQVQIRNLTSHALDFHFFDYSDFAMSGPVQLGQTGHGFYDQAFIGGTGCSLTDDLDCTVAPGANRGLAGVDTRGLLNDTLPTTLVDCSGPANNARWTWEWDNKISGKSSWSVTNFVTLAAVPEPSVAAVALLGLLVLAKAFGRRAVGLS